MYLYKQRQKPNISSRPTHFHIDRYVALYKPIQKYTRTARGINSDMQLTQDRGPSPRNHGMPVGQLFGLKTSTDNSM